MSTQKYRFMKNGILILTTLLVVFVNLSIAAGTTILSVQSIDIAPYQEALKGFQSTYNGDMQSFIISEMKDKDVISEIRKKNPSVILALGVDALKKIKDIKEIPVIYMMVPSPQPLTEGAMNLTGVRMNIKQKNQLSYFMKAIPSMKTIGLLYDPERTEFLAQSAIDASKNAGVDLIAQEVKSSKEVPSAINKMEGRIDGFWMLPDVTVFTSEGLEYLFLFSIKNKIPILTFSDVYLESGALISTGVDTFDMGAQAGEMAMEIVGGKHVQDVPPVDARKEDVSINLKIAGKLGIIIDETLFADAKFLK